MNPASSAARGPELPVARLSRAVVVPEFVESFGGAAAFERVVEQSSTPDELAAQLDRGGSLEGQVVRVLAKQLVVEILGGVVDLSDVEIVAAGSGRPTISLSHTPSGTSPGLHLSMSHDAAMAAAFVVLEGQPDKS